jgi:transglutaminase-like putative cysteine protease
LTRETLKLMRLLTREGKKLPEIRSLAINLTSDLEPKDSVGEIKALWQYVLTNFRYIKDTTDVEVLHTVDNLLDRMSGDCDDASVLLASLLESIGHPTRFAALAFTSNNFEHVLVQTPLGNPRLDSNWISLDATEDRPFGWYPPGVSTRMLIHNGS